MLFPPSVLILKNHSFHFEYNLNSPLAQLVVATQKIQRFIHLFVFSISLVSRITRRPL